jgi:hypothetical protein
MINHAKILNLKKQLDLVLEAYDQIVLPDEQFSHSLADNAANSSLILKLSNAFMAKKTRTERLAHLGLCVPVLKERLMATASTLVQVINSELQEDSVDHVGPHS